MIVVLVVSVAAVLAIRRLRRPSSSTRPPLPPGPTPIPILGNVLALNADAPYLTYTEWAKTYGDILYTQILGQEIIVLNSEEVAINLLEKRSRKYSDRPGFATADLFGWEWSSPLTQYGPRFRQHRRLYHEFFRASASLSYRPRQLQAAHEMLTRIRNNPTHYAEHIETFAATVILSVTYGCDINGEETFGKSLKRGMDIMLRFSTPESAALCTTFPFAKKLPAWFPFMGFKSKAAECRKLTHDGLHGSYAWVRQQIDQGTAMPSLVGDTITKNHLDDSKDPQLVQELKESAASLYSAAADTANSVILIFVYFMMLNPEVQARAQAEIDLEAMLREILRCRPVAPIGLAHATSEDDIYEGYYIPKGATIMANVWAMSQNEAKYPNPTAFLPERFLRSDGTLNDDKFGYIFGFGRRICPGRHLADASLWCAMASILAAFKLEKPEGFEEVKWVSGATTIVPRGEDEDGQRLAALIHASRVDS
ncbi:hypothetical protein PAXINDRAFT_7853 [Paxillus involutus ATCC 200175]|nr:hypothetical protein PAXINDRAFT_7853 [Paxillus involutus ATCC 200175]